MSYFNEFNTDGSFLLEILFYNERTRSHHYTLLLYTATPISRRQPTHKSMNQPPRFAMIVGMTSWGVETKELIGTTKR